MAGKPLKVIQELLGHADIEMTMRYSHLAPSVHEDAVAALDDLHLSGPHVGNGSEARSQVLETKR